MRRRLREKINDFKHLTLGLPRFAVKATDCFVTSFPRAGNTWMRYMLLYALFPDEQWDLPRIEQRMPIIDRHDIRRAIGAMGDAPFRLFKSHEPFQPHYLAGRTAYIVRDGRDAIVSYYHYRQHMNHLEMELSQYIDQSLRGRFRYGAWQDHVAGWLAHAEHPSILIVRYEDMVENPARELKRVLEHFGQNVSDEQIDRAVERSSVENVNKGFAKWAKQQSRQFSGGLGGGSGKGKQLLSAADQQLFVQYAGEMLRKLGYLEADHPS